MKTNPANKPTRQSSGFTLTEMLTTVGVVGFLCSIAIPHFVRARDQAQNDLCISNLRQIESAIEQWAAENRKGSFDAVRLNDVSGGPNKHLRSSINTQIKCPGGGIYSVTTVEALPSCSRGGNHKL